MKSIRILVLFVLSFCLFQCESTINDKKLTNAPKIPENVQKVLIDSLNNKITFYSRNARSEAFDYCPKGTVGEGCVISNVFEGNEDCGIIASGIKLTGILGCNSGGYIGCIGNLSGNVRLLLIDSQGNIIVNGCPGCGISFYNIPFGDYIVIAQRTSSGHIEIGIDASPGSCESCSDYFTNC